MNRKKTQQKYYTASNNILISDYYYCLNGHRRQAIAIKSSIDLLLSGPKIGVDIFYIKEKLRTCEQFESIYIILDEIQRRMRMNTLSEAEFLAGNF